MAINNAENFLIYTSRLSFDDQTRTKVVELCRKELDWCFIARKAYLEGVGGLVYYNLKKAGLESLVPKTELLELRQIYYKTIFTNLRMLQKLKPILNTLAEKKIPFLLIQGASLQETIYRNPGLRPLDDIDVVIKEEDLTAVKAILVNSGLSSSKQYPEIFSQEGLVIDLHLNIANSSRIASRSNIFRLDNGLLWKESITSRLCEVPITLLSPDHSLLALSAHLVKHSFSRLIWFVDIMEIIERYRNQWDWPKLMATAERFNLKRPLYYCLLYLKEVMEAEFPSSFLAELASPALNYGEISLAKLLLQNKREHRTGDFLFFFAARGIKAKILFLVETCFPTPKIMAQIFGLYPQWLRWLYYPFRLGQLLKMAFKELICYKKS